MKIAVCDSELPNIQEFISLLRTKLDSYSIHTTIVPYDSREILYKKLSKSYDYDIIILDGNTEHMRNIVTVETIRGVGSKARMVYVNSPNDCAMVAYKNESHRCYLKNGLDELLEECIAVVMAKRDVAPHCFTYNFLEGTRTLNAEQIVYVESKGRKLTFNIDGDNDAPYHLNRKLDVIERELHYCGFLRIHQSYLVNIKFIEEMTKYWAKTSTGVSLPIPKAKYKEVKEKYGEMRGWLSD
ncbi:MAG: LytTR family transcriptional regulator DNA-binding domain-containing protein [Lachnospiraceae bacterium]|jgi:DNA-binding LytR/AlgR family response regulator|nr:LytTR family transcriptional regulator DNA-binding domain-containing protein [Lachnospiraceae bacterium]